MESETNSDISEEIIFRLKQMIEKLNRIIEENEKKQ
jgi:hypothetical protein